MKDDIVISKMIIALQAEGAVMARHSSATHLSSLKPVKEASCLHILILVLV